MDKRTKQYRHLHRWFNKYTRASAVAGLIVGSLITLAYVDAVRKQPVKELLSPLSEVQGVEPTPTPDESYYKAEPLRYIRWKGQQLGYKDTDISVFIRIARAESGLNQYAKNPKSTAKGIYQFIDGTWRAYCLADGNVYNFVDNINCFYKVLAKDGFPKGLSHWNASKGVWK
jgi:soluble lytic murein transglycosylase-like protein